MPARRAKFAMVNLDTGELDAPKQRAPHQFEGSGYTLHAKGTRVPLRHLKLTGTEWDTIDFLNDHDGAHAFVPLTPKTLAADLGIKETAARKALTRLVKLGLCIKPSPRAGAYQLTPLRFWEGSGAAQKDACARLTPPSVKPDDKALGRTPTRSTRSTAAKAAAPKPRNGAARTGAAPKLVDIASLLGEDEAEVEEAPAPPTVTARTTRARRTAAERTPR